MSKLIDRKDITFVNLDLCCNRYRQFNFDT